MESGTIIRSKNQGEMLDHPPGWIFYCSSTASWYSTKKGAFERLHEVAEAHGRTVEGARVDLTPEGAQQPSSARVTLSDGKPRVPDVSGYLSYSVPAYARKIEGRIRMGKEDGASAEYALDTRQGMIYRKLIKRDGPYHRQWSARAAVGERIEWKPWEWEEEPEFLRDAEWMELSYTSIPI